MGLLPSHGQVQSPRPQNTHTLLCGTQLRRLAVQQLAAGPAQEHPSAYSFRTFLGSPRTLLRENATQTHWRGAGLCLKDQAVTAHLTGGRD